MSTPVSDYDTVTLPYQYLYLHLFQTIQMRVDCDLTVSVSVSTPVPDYDCVPYRINIHVYTCSRRQSAVSLLSPGRWNPPPLLHRPGDGRVTQLRRWGRLARPAGLHAAHLLHELHSLRGGRGAGVQPGGPAAPVGACLVARGSAVPSHAPDPPFHSASSSQRGSQRQGEQRSPSEPPSSGAVCESRGSPSLKVLIVFLDVSNRELETHISEFGSCVKWRWPSWAPRP